MTGAYLGVAALAAVAITLSTAGSGLGQILTQAGEDEQQRQAMTTTYEIGVTSVGTFTPIATLSFDSTNTGTLVLGAWHARTPQLVQIWHNLSDRDMIHVKKSLLEDDDYGNTTYTYVGVDVAKSDPEFPEAILRFMAHEYGFDSRP